MNKIKKIHFLTFAILVLVSIAGKAGALDPNSLLNFPPASQDAIQSINPLNATVNTSPDEYSSIVRTTCSKFPGFFNRLVKCITSMTTREVTFFTIWKISNVFASAANAMLVVYIVFFGLKMSMNALENNRNDIIVFLLVCFFITFANNHVRVISAIKFFMTVQNEFAYAATAALYSSQDGQLKKDITRFPNASNAMKEEIKSKYFCYGPILGKDDLPTPGVYYNIWQRMDCLVVYMLGMHPLVTRLSQFTTDIGENSIQEYLNSTTSAPPSSVAGAINNASTLLSSLAQNAVSSDGALINSGAMSGKYSYELMYGSRQPFESMINDAFCWFKQKPDISFLDPSIPNSLTTLDKLLKIKELIKDKCFLDRVGLTQTQLNAINNLNTTSDVSALGGIITSVFTNFGKNMLTKPYPSNGDKYQVSLASSFIVILVGSLFSSDFGFFSFILGFGVILLMFFAFAQAAMVYVTSLFAILLLGLFAPIIIPLFLFKPTRGIFESWLQMFFVYTLQPGLLLCYLTMMILVLQFIVFEKHDIYNPVSQTAEKASFIDLMFGDYYQKADKSRKAQIEIYDKLAAGKDASIAGALSSGNQTENPFIESSIYGSGDAEYYVAGMEEAVSSPQNPFTYGLLGLKNTGGSSTSISFPSFNFYGSDFGTGIGARQNLANAAVTNIAKYNATASDLQALFLDMQAGKSLDSLTGLIQLYDCGYSTNNSNLYICKNAVGGNVTIPLTPEGKPDFSQPPLNGLILAINQVGENYQQIKQQSARYKLLFIQCMFIILVTLAITISFMHTVMELAGKIAGASATPIGKASGVYDLLADKLKKTAMKTG